MPRELYINEHIQYKIRSDRDPKREEEEEERNRRTQKRERRKESKEDKTLDHRPKKIEKKEIYIDLDSLIVVNIVNKDTTENCICFK